MGIYLLLGLIAVYFLLRKEIRITRTFSLKGFWGKFLIAFLFVGPIVAIEEDFIKSLLFRVLLSLTVAGFFWLVGNMLPKKDEQPACLCTICNNPGRVWSPWGGSPVTDCLCFKHRFAANLKNPQTYFILLFLALIVALGLVFSSAAFANCQKKAESYAVASELKDNSKGKFQAKGTQKVTDAKTLKAYGAKADEEMYNTEVYDADGAFVPYDVTVKTKNCALVSAKAVTL